MTARTRTAAPLLVALSWAGARLLLPPDAHNTHTLMYPLVEAAGAYNTLEPFHPLYHPVVALVRRLWEACGGAGPALPALQAVSLLAGMANLALIHRVVLRAGGSAAAAFGAAALAAVTQNLWSWSLMTTSYTLSTACALAAVHRLLSRERLDARDAAWAGAWTALATGFDTAAGLVALPALYELRARGAKGASAAFGGGLVAVLAAAYAVFFHRLQLLGWPFPPTLAGLAASLPRDIVPLWKSGDPFGQFAAFWRSDAPADFPWLAAPALLALSWRATSARAWGERALWRLAAGLWAAVTAFFFLNDPQNRFVYAGGLLLPAVLATAAPRHWPGAVVLLFCFNLFRPPLYAPDSNPGLAEADWLAGRLAPGDLLVALSEPDWALSYGLMGRVGVVVLAGPGGGTARFRQSVMDEARAEEAADRALCNGAKVVFAPDALYRSTERDKTELDARARRLVERWSRRYAAGPAWVSPRDQHYMPLAPKPGACARP
ncbi:MAG: hypothetical protein SF051_07420 [Elusimicrobiota bacterium]|nr:hypothetical protein [Elusimicrobiota bacterium]